MPVELDHRPGDRLVAVTVDDDPFTTYRYGGDDAPAKPACDPVRGPDGRAVTRGYPRDPRPGERVDHDHHVGFWFAYGNVNGYDFWNDAVRENRAGVGQIRHDAVERVEGGDPGELAVTADWVDPDDRTHLREETAFRFHADGGDRRAVDRITTLTAVRDADLADDKEGLCAVRVRSELEHPEAGEITVVDDPDAGTTTTVDGRDGRTGAYRTSQGVTGTDAWGTRARWVRLSGQVDGDPLSVTLMDHPENVGHPTDWHARGYGLFAANPLGQAVFSDGERRLGLSLSAGESATFRHRLAIDAGTPAPDALDGRYRAFVDGTR